jgi:hypothetical protein
VLPALLPVSGVAMAVREPTGDDEVYLVETRLPPLPALLGLACRVTSAVSGGPLDWPRLPAADLAVAALVIRRSLLGDWIRAEARCSEPDCRELIDVSFSSGDYLRYHQPRLARGVVAAPESGWYTFAGTAVLFRVPTVADLLGLADEPDAADASGAEDRLAGRCVKAAGISRGLARRLDRAFVALAPDLDDLVGGHCPACGRDVMLRFDPLGYTLAELRDAFSGVYLQAHALASAYGWPEEAILGLPRGRRRRYASIIASEQALP